MSGQLPWPQEDAEFSGVSYAGDRDRIAVLITRIFLSRSHFSKARVRVCSKGGS
jgi:hypothetical protein